jgi:hypothetical protein
MRWEISSLLLAAVFAGAAIGQTEMGEVAGVRHAVLKDGELSPGGDPDYGPMIWNNLAVLSWWATPDTGYLNLDWGKLPIPSSGLDDHVIDGFTFIYGSNNMDPAGETWAVDFFEGCTGWGSLGVPEAGFVFNGLPNGYGLPPVPYSHGWIWSITVDLEDSGYEFLLGHDLGHGLSRLSSPQTGWTGPAIGAPPNTHGNGPTGTEMAFSIYFPNGTYNGTWWFSGVWVTWPAALFGTEGEANMTFYGVGAQGNDAGLYAAGSFSAGSSLHFMLRRNQLPLDGYLAASLSSASNYFGGAWDVTRLVGGLTAGSPLLMRPDSIGDFCFTDVDVPLQYSNLTVYFQGLLATRPLIQPPLDASNGLRAN